MCFFLNLHAFECGYITIYIYIYIYIDICIYINIYVYPHSKAWRLKKKHARIYKKARIYIEHFPRRKQKFEPKKFNVSPLEIPEKTPDFVFMDL